MSNEERNRLARECAGPMYDECQSLEECRHNSEALGRFIGFKAGYDAVCAEVERLEGELDFLREELLFKREPVELREPDMSAAYEEKIEELKVELARHKQALEYMKWYLRDFADAQEKIRAILKGEEK